MGAWALRKKERQHEAEESREEAMAENNPETVKDISSMGSGGPTNPQQYEQEEIHAYTNRYEMAEKSKTGTTLTATFGGCWGESSDVQ